MAHKSSDQGLCAFPSIHRYVSHWQYLLHFPGEYADADDFYPQDIFLDSQRQNAWSYYIRNFTLLGGTVDWSVATFECPCKQFLDKWLDPEHLWQMISCFCDPIGTWPDWATEMISSGFSGSVMIASTWATSCFTVWQVCQI